MGLSVLVDHSPADVRGICLPTTQLPPYLALYLPTNLFIHLSSYLPTQVFLLVGFLVIIPLPMLL